MNNSITHALKRTTAMAAFIFLMTVAGGTAVAVEPEGALKSKEVKALVANAKTPADHLKLARHFNAMAKKHDAEALEHEELAAEYARNPRLGSSKTPMAPNSAEHCKYFADHCRKAAKEMRAMAAAHESMAKEAEKQ
jgi:hypothetical protein